MLLVLTAAAALIPSILLMWYFHSRDLFAEPTGVLWRGGESGRPQRPLSATVPLLK